MYLCEILFIGQYRHQEKDNSIIASNERESRNLSRLSRLKVPAYDREACKQKPNVPLKLIACLSS
jgi:hypothetical protein